MGAAAAGFVSGVRAGAPTAVGLGVPSLAPLTDPEAPSLLSQMALETFQVH